MSVPPKKFQLNREDVPDAPKWFDKLLEALNPFVAQTVQAFTQGLTRAQNLASEVKTVELNTPALPEHAFPLMLKHSLPTQPYALWLAQVHSLDGHGTAGGVALGSWSLRPDGQIQVDLVDGLVGEAKYRLTFIIE